jgi:hypothetical protein
MDGKDISEIGGWHIHEKAQIPRVGGWPIHENPQIPRVPLGLERGWPIHEIQPIPRVPHSCNLTGLKQNFALLREMIANE